ncbi:hypothetical protein [Hyalangium versicolor]|uniref:hypothetical protein n=1 Tax=Hyalangium versicolor TaxID=2861190 RepID=UPI001CC97978|nr:hypothetical protein [Hyalangium versicolor]
MERTFSSSCPRCGAPRAPAPECPQCGVYYSRAEARAARAAQATLAAEPPVDFAAPNPERPPHLPAETLRWDGNAEDARMELKIRLFAVPAALLLMWMLHSTGMGHRLLRTFLSMWIHESGHAVTAWLCGFLSFPGPWATPVAEMRSPFFSLLLAGGLGYLTWRGWKRRERLLLISGPVLLALQFVGTVLIGRAKAQSFVTFGGDGGCMVLGTLLMTTLYASPESQLRKGWLRWGFLVIGAAAFTDAFKVWWNSRSDLGAIPFGISESAGLSDPSRLTDWYGWSVNTLISRYVTLGVLCLVVLGMVYGVGVFRARAAVRA